MKSNNLERLQPSIYLQRSMCRIKKQVEVNSFDFTILNTAASSNVEAYRCDTISVLIVRKTECVSRLYTKNDERTWSRVGKEKSDT